MGVEGTAGNGRRAIRSLLTPWVRRLLIVALTLAVFMLGNTLYLLTNRLADSAGWRYFADGETSLPKLFQVMVLSHTGVGLALVFFMLVFAVAHLPKVWKRRHKASVLSGLLYVAAGMVLAVTGLFILSEAASKQNTWAWWTHVVCAVAAPATYGIHRAVSYVKPSVRSFRGFGLAVASVLVLLVVGHSFSHRGQALTREAVVARDKGLGAGPGGRERNIAGVAKDFFDNDFVPAAFVPPGSPFFPSAATTSSGDYLPSRIITRNDLGAPDQLAPDLEKFGFVVNTKIGATTCDRCHPDIVEQWSASAHRFASFNNPFYEATINDMRKNATEPNFWVNEHIKHYPETADRVGMVKSKWCSACHDPSLMLAGKMNVEVDRRTPEAQAGLTCLACHAIDKIHNQTGNGGYNIADEQEDPYLFADAPVNTVRTFLHDLAIKAKPTVHKRQMLKPFFRTSEYCSSCHKVSLNVPVNNYRWLRGQNEFDNWHDSGVALNASRTFYLPPAKRECQDCHMPYEPAPLGDFSAKNGMVRSHRFIAVNTALPFVRGDEDTIKRIEAFLRDEKLSVDIFAVTPEGSDRAIMAIDHAQPVLRPGQQVTADVVVRNKGVGHTFPGGTNDSNEGWLEFTVRDQTGKTLLISGKVGEDGHLDPDAHVYKALIVDRDSQPIHRRNAQDIYVMVFANVIGPGTADVARYQFVVPSELDGGKLELTARLLWRKFDRHYTEFAYNANPEGFKRFDKVPDLPITEIARDDVTLLVSEAAASVGAEYAGDPKEWVRYNDYGIAALLDGDTRTAVAAFSKVADLQPGRVDGHLNLTKTAMQDGNIQEAYVHLRECERIEPGNARVAWMWGVTLQEDGRYAEAAMAYRRVLEDFPEDRATWRNLGRTYYLDHQYERAIEVYNEVLKIDPEDRVAHYHIMLCNQALGRPEEAATASAAYEYYKIDESAAQITKAFRLTDPGANLETQLLHSHVLSGPVGKMASVTHDSAGNHE